MKRNGVRAAAIAVCLLFAIDGFTQVINATLSGTVSDPSGDRISSSDACGFGSTGAETDVCLMVVDTEVGPGAWAASVFWQLGQATEDYTLDVVVYGVAA